MKKMVSVLLLKYLKAKTKMIKIFTLIFIIASSLYGKENLKDKYIFLGNDKMAPIIYLKDSKANGIVVDLTKALVEKSGLNIDIKLMDWDKAQEKVFNQEADALLHININKERAKKYDFSENLFKSDFCIFKRYDRNDIQNIKSLYNLKVGAEIKGFPASILRKYPKIRVQTLSSLKEGLELLQKGEIDAIISNRWGGEYLLATNDLSEITIVDKPIASLYSKIAVKKGNTKLLNKINEGIKKIQEDGTIFKILKKWDKYKIIYFTQQQYDYIILFIAIAILIIFLFILIIFAVYKIKRVNLSLEKKQLELKEKSEQLELSKQKLKELNNFLEKKIEKELKKNTEQQLILMHQSKLVQMGEMIGNIAHQWRQPLAQINSTVLLIDLVLEKNNSKNPTIENHLTEIESLTAYMSKTIDNFRNFFNPNKIKTTFKIEYAVKKANNILKGLLSFHQIKVNINIQKNLECFNYLEELQQVILIILNNAIDALILKKITLPIISIYGYEEDDYITICIEDNALGINKEYLDKIFEPYFTTKYKTKGTGLGLYIAKMIVENGLMGHLNVENKTKGTCFIIKIPKEKKL